MEESEYHRIAAAQDAHWWYRSTRRLVQSLVAPWSRPGMRALDIGCGPGGNGAWLAAAATPAGAAVGLDIERVGLEYVRAGRDGLVPVQASATHLPVADRCVDLALLLTVLYHVVDDAAAVREVARVLRPGGAVLFLEPAFPILQREHDVLTHGLRRYRRPALVALARSAGLEVQRATYAKSFLFPAAAAVALGQRLRPDDVATADARSDLEPRRTDRVAVPVFDRLSRAEERWLARRDVPVGTSVVVLAVRPG